MSDNNSSLPFIDTVVVYKSIECGHLFSTDYIPAGTIYPTVVMFECPWCKRTHTYRAREAHIVSTPSKRRAFAEYCKKLSIVDVGVKIKLNK